MTLKLAMGVLVAAAAWTAMFAGRREGFWTRAAIAGAVIGAYAVAVDPGAIGHQLAQRRWVADLGVGVGAGLVLYGIFWIGEQALVVVLPRLADEVGDLYRVKQHAAAYWMPLVLAVIAPGEELFFRGLMWHRAGVGIALAVYSLVHLPERKVILIVAALVGGAWWGALFSWTGGLVAPLASHLVWGLLIIVWRPVRPAPWAVRLSARLRRLPAAG